MRTLRFEESQSPHGHVTRRPAETGAVRGNTPTPSPRLRPWSGIANSQAFGDKLVTWVGVCGAGEWGGHGSRLHTRLTAEPVNRSHAWHVLPEA